jgi:type IV secretory pathway VirB10-like protein
MHFYYDEQLNTLSKKPTKNMPSNPNFLQPSLTQRSVSALFAIVFTALFISQFLAVQFQKNEHKLDHEAMQLSWISLIKPSLPATPNTTPPAKQEPLPPASISIAKAPVSISPVHSEIANQVTTEKQDSIDVFAETPANNTVSVSKTKYDSDAVRRAYQDSKTDIQKMAEASGKPLVTTPASKYDKFQTAANNAAKPDCLRQGGSILSLFVVAYQVATDHCR